MKAEVMVSNIPNCEEKEREYLSINIGLLKIHAYFRWINVCLFLNLKVIIIISAVSLVK